METYITSKGQIVIPSQVRRKFGIMEGTRIEVSVDDEKHVIVLTPITREFVHGMRGRHKGKALLKALTTEKKKERDL